MELGLITFADMAPETLKGRGINAQQRLKDLMEEIQLADQLGLDVFGVGEHHRADYAVSSPAIILAAAAMITKKIKLTSAVTVLSSDDPVRVYQQFSEVDLLSGGRAEIMAGRGSFIESFPLFGFDLEDYDSLFEEKLDLLLALNKNEKISWNGKHRTPLNDMEIFPHPSREKIPIWLAAGGTPASAIRAAKLGLPLTLAIIGGSPNQFIPFIKLYRNTYMKHHKSPIQLGINNHLFINETSEKASDIYFPFYAETMSRIGRDRGWPPFTRSQYELMKSAVGSLMVGSVQQVTEKILYEFELFGQTRFMGQASVGLVPHKEVMKSIELFGTKVADGVRKHLPKTLVT